MKYVLRPDVEGDKTVSASVDQVADHLIKNASGVISAEPLDIGLITMSVLNKIRPERTQDMVDMFFVGLIIGMTYQVFLDREGAKFVHVDTSVQ